jgi:hypothetical protein
MSVLILGIFTSFFNSEFLFLVPRKAGACVYLPPLPVPIEGDSNLPILQGWCTDFSFGMKIFI